MSLHMDWMFDVSKRAVEKTTGALWPYRSIVSNRPAGGDACLTAEDFKALSFISGPICNRCGSPQEFLTDDDLTCSSCLAREPAWQRARAALVYDDSSARPILALKRAGRRDGLATMARWMRRAADDVLTDADIITAVPLHRSRLASRGYNQAIWLGAALGRCSGVPFQTAILHRKRNTPSQGGLSARARKRNVSGAFDVGLKQRERIQDKRVVLVDDVLTTGATVAACASALCRAGASAVDIVTVARVVHEQDATI